MIKINIAIYSRKSIETDTGESIKTQITICKDYFNRQYDNCKFEIFEDEGFSGSNTNRPSFKKMMELAKLKSYDVIAVYKLDRIARNIVDFVNIYDDLEKVNIKLVSITEGFDPSTPVGKMMMLLLASFAEMERMNIAQRIKDNMRELAKMGRWSGGTAPLGYKPKRIIENGKEVSYLELVKENSSDIRWIFENYAKGFSTYKLSKMLKDKGLNYSNKTIINILTNPTYLSSTNQSIKYLEKDGYLVYGKPTGYGFLPYNRRPKLNGKKLTTSIEKFVGVSKHESIIDLDLWINVQEMLKSKRSDPKPRESNLSYLSGMIKCICGSTMYIDPGKYRKDGTRFYYFRCSSRKINNCRNKSIRLDIIETYIIDYFEKLLNNQENLKVFLKKDAAPKLQDKINSTKSKIDKNNTYIDNLLDKLSLLSNEASTMLTKKINNLVKQNNHLKEDLLKLEKENLLNERNLLELDIIFTTMDYFIKNKNISIDEKKSDIKLLLEYIIWDSKNKRLSAKLKT